VTATINPLPSAPTTISASSCTNATVTLTASGGSPGQYIWYTSATGGTAIPNEVNSTYVTPVLSVTTTYYVSILNASCEGSRAAAVATIDIVAKPTITTINCTATSATISGPAGFSGYSWTTGAKSQQITVSTAGSFTVTLTDANGCSSPPSDAVSFTSSFCNQPPVIVPATFNATIEGTSTIDLLTFLTDPDNNLDLSTLKIIQQPTSGASATINAAHKLILDYTGRHFAGNDQLTIEVCDLDGACTKQVLSITVVGDIIIYNGISPDGNKQNDTWQIQYIELLEDTKVNHVSIFNRWGDTVFEISNYDNSSRVFTGINKNGGELPTGTYFYKIEFSSGRQTQTGYLSLKR
jgi:gliding motility-associated-like protein